MAASDDLFLDWLTKSPCRFARAFVSADKLKALELLDPFVARDVASIDLFLDQAAKHDEVGLVLWPLLRTAEDLVALLNTLCTSERWDCARADWGKHARDDAVLVGLRWKTPAGDSSSVMGFAPLGSMPVTRRAPYVALALWPGRHECAHPKLSSPAGEVGFIDCKLPKLADDPKYSFSNLLKQTQAAVHKLLAYPPPDDYETLRNVAFTLPSDCVRALAGFDERSRVRAAGEREGAA